MLKNYLHTFPSTDFAKIVHADERDGEVLIHTLSIILFAQSEKYGSIKYVLKKDVIFNFYVYINE